MKRFISVLALTLVLVLALSPAAFGLEVRLNGNAIDTLDANGAPVQPFIEDGTTYVPVRAIATALNIGIDWDGATRTVFIGSRGSAEPVLGDEVNIYIGGAKFNPTDANGKAVYPIIKDGTTFLPVRAIAQAFAKKVDWDSAAQAVLISDSAEIDTSKTYKIVLSGTDSVISPVSDGNGAKLHTAVFTGSANEIWRFVPVAGQDGFYQIINQGSSLAMDVNGESRVPGANILQYTPGGGENQKFMLMAQPDGSYKIYSKNSMLPFESSAGIVMQSADRDSSVQCWELVEATATAQPEETVYNAITLSDGRSLTYKTDAMELTASPLTYNDDQRWNLAANAAGFYYIQTKNGGKSIDVANNSTTDGDPLITYDHSGDDNQCWIFEKQEDGGYKIKSVHSGLYIKVLSNGSVVQSAEGDVFTLY